MVVSNLLQADIFFFIATLGLLAVAAGVVVALLYLIKILRDFKAITTQLREFDWQEGIVPVAIALIRSVFKSKKKPLSKSFQHHDRTKTTEAS